MKTLLYATTNDYKLSAANLALSNHGILLTKLPIDIPEVIEIQADSQEQVATHKAKQYYELLKQPLVAMDFGFFIEGLGGFPGPYTKYANDTIGVNGLIRLTRELDDQRAYAMRTIAYIDSHELKVFSYNCPGEILLVSRGESSRGFDTIFRVDATGRTLAEMTEEEKADTSGHAWWQLGDWLQSKNEI